MHATADTAVEPASATPLSDPDRFDRIIKILAALQSELRGVEQPTGFRDFPLDSLEITPAGMEAMEAETLQGTTIWRDCPKQVAFKPTETDRLTTIMHFRFMNRDGTRGNRGGATVIYTPEGGGIIGLSLCSPSDNFDRAEGRRVASERLQYLIDNPTTRYGDLTRTGLLAVAAGLVTMGFVQTYGRHWKSFDQIGFGDLESALNSLALCGRDEPPVYIRDIVLPSH